MSAANYLETANVIDCGRDPVASRHVDDLVAAAGLEVEPVTREHAELARAAYRDFGTGSGHPARRNLGDALLCKGDDFVHTDVALAVQPSR
jgi:ribonuclease VapC